MNHPTEDQVNAALSLVVECDRLQFQKSKYLEAAERLYLVTGKTDLACDVVAATVLAAAVRWLRDGRDKTRECLK